jgi:hypothetical protein
MRKLRGFTQRRIEGFTEELDDIFSTVDSGGSGRAGRVGVGVYYYEDD